MKDQPPRSSTRNFLTKFVIMSISKRHCMKAVYTPNVALEFILTLCRYKVPIVDVIHLNAHYIVPLYAASHDARFTVNDRSSTCVGQLWPFLYSPFGVFFLPPVTSIIMFRTKKLHFVIKIPSIPAIAFASGV